MRASLAQARALKCVLEGAAGLAAEASIVSREGGFDMQAMHASSVVLVCASFDCAALEGALEERAVASLVFLRHAARALEDAAAVQLHVAGDRLLLESQLGARATQYACALLEPAAEFFEIPPGLEYPAEARLASKALAQLVRQLAQLSDSCTLSLDTNALTAECATWRVTGGRQSDDVASRLELKGVAARGAASAQVSTDALKRALPFLDLAEACTLRLSPTFPLELSLAGESARVRLYVAPKMEE